jgi:ATP-dependent Lon protease
MTAMSYARSKFRNYEVDPKLYYKSDVHIHIPKNAIPKDGPSAGSALAVSILSAATNKPVINSFGITGEITLRGKILRVGGIKEKILAAKRAGLTKIIVPTSNQPDVEEIPTRNLQGVHVYYVETMEDVLPLIMP